MSSNFKIVIVDSTEVRGKKLKDKLASCLLITGFNPNNPLRPQLESLPCETLLLTHARDVLEIDMSRFVKQLNFSGGGNNKEILGLETGDEFTASEWHSFLEDWDKYNKPNLKLLLSSPSKELIEKLSPYYLAQSIEFVDVRINLFNRLQDWWKHLDLDRRELITEDNAMSSVVAWLNKEDVNSEIPPICGLARGYL